MFAARYPRRHESKKMPSGWWRRGGVHSSQRWKQSKHMGGPTAITADSAIITVGPPITGWVRCADGTSEHRLNLPRQIVKKPMRIDRRFLATSHPLGWWCFRISIWSVCFIAYNGDKSLLDLYTNFVSMLYSLWDITAYVYDITPLLFNAPTERDSLNVFRDWFL